MLSNIKNNWFKIVAAIVLLFALGNYSYGFYQLTRWITTIAAIYSAYLAHKSSRMVWMWVFIAVAVLFNPIAPFYLKRNTWHILDILSAGLFIFSLSPNKKHAV